MTGESAEDMGLKLKGARERLCVVQVMAARRGESETLVGWAQEAIDLIDRLGLFLDPRWSEHNLPSVADPDDPTAR